MLDDVADDKPAVESEPAADWKTNIVKFDIVGFGLMAGTSDVSASHDVIDDRMQWKSMVETVVEAALGVGKLVVMSETAFEQKWMTHQNHYDGDRQANLNVYERHS